MRWMRLTSIPSTVVSKPIYIFILYQIVCVVERKMKEKVNEMKESEMMRLNEL